MTSSAPRVTVIMPTHNGQQFLAAAIDSVLTQTLTDLELIVVDDGSTDATPALLADYAKRDVRLRVLTRPKASGGPTIPKNQAIAVARGGYLCFLDHDDIYLPGKLAAMCEAMDAHPAWVAAFHDVQLIHGDGRHFDNTYLGDHDFLNAAADYLTPLQTSRPWFECSADYYIFMSLRYAGIHTDSVIVAPARCLADPISFRKRFRGSDDTDLWLRIGAQGRMGFLNEVQALYRIHPGNLSADAIRMNENGIELHRANISYAAQRMNAEQLGRYRAKINKYQTELGYKLYMVGQFGRSRAVYWRALREGALARGLQGIAKASLHQLWRGVKPS